MKNGIGSWRETTEHGCVETFERSAGFFLLTVRQNSLGGTWAAFLDVDRSVLDESPFCLLTSISASYKHPTREAAQEAADGMLGKILKEHLATIERERDEARRDLAKTQVALDRRIEDDESSLRGGCGADACVVGPYRGRTPRTGPCRCGRGPLRAALRQARAEASDVIAGLRETIAREREKSLLLENDCLETARELEQARQSLEACRTQAETLDRREERSVEPSAPAKDEPASDGDAGAESDVTSDIEWVVNTGGGSCQFQAGCLSGSSWMTGNGKWLAFISIRHRRPIDETRGGQLYQIACVTDRSTREEATDAVVSMLRETLSDAVFRQLCAMPPRSEKLSKLSFGAAINLLRSSGPGARAWRGPWDHSIYSSWLELQVPDERSRMTAPCVLLCTSDGDRLPWIPSQRDMLSDDWLTLPAQ